MNATAVAPTPPSEGRLAYKWKVLISVVFGVFMVILDTTVVNIAFRTLNEEFAAGVNDAQWVISIYVLALGVSTPISGYLADRFGLKRVFLTGLTLFVFGSFLCGLAPTLPILILARAFQGLGGGIALPLGPALLFSAFPPKEQGTALGLFGIALVVAPALGPILGGWLVDAGHWRWIFFINVPIGIVGVLLGSRFLRHQGTNKEETLDWMGLIASTIGFGSILYAASIAAEQGWSSGRVVTFLAVGTVALVAFAIIELYISKNPLLDLRLFKNRVFTNATIVGWVAVVALFSAEFLLPLYLQILRGRTALETGIILLPLALTSGIALPLAGKLYDRIGARPLLVTGFAVLIVNTWQLSQLKADTPISWILFLLALRGLALGLTVQTTFVTALAPIPLPKLPRGSALSNSTRQVVQALSVAILATVLASSLTPGLAAQLEAFQQAAPPALLASQSGENLELCQLPNSDLPLPQQARGSITQFCDEYIQGLENAYHVTFYAAILALILGAFLPGWPFGWQGRQQAQGEPGAQPAGTIAH
jgi:DHA2 family multidrug resistance protein